MTAILVTRPLGEVDPLVALLEDLGYRVHAVPTVAIEAVPIDAAAVSGFDWIVVTSAAGVAALPELPLGSRWAAVGAATAAALAGRGVTADLVPEEANGAALAEALPEPAGRRILLARADAAAADLPDRLRERGAEVVELTVYRTLVGPESSRVALAEALADPGLAAAVFASGSAVRGFLALGGPVTLPAVSIGPRTSTVAREAGFKVIVEAGGRDVQQLASAVAASFPMEVITHG